MVQAQLAVLPAEGGALDWRIDDAPVPYLAALAFMDARAAAIRAGRARP